MITTLPADARAQYRLHKMMLQHCQYGRPPKYWVLKGFHGRRLATFFDTYPDACMVWTHRDPVQLIASQIVLFGQINRAWPAVSIGRSRGERRVRELSANLNEPLIDDPRIIMRITATSCAIRWTRSRCSTRSIGSFCRGKPRRWRRTSANNAAIATESSSIPWTSSGETSTP
jgi:hypothetical protein